ncbi:MAG: DUF975 family protein [Lachnospiraceae bacterium]|nr:DUF975 family protein [Lachnospiraceae bacterium]
MATRAELKERAKELLRGNYWGCVIAALILSLIGGITGYNASSSSANSKYTPKSVQEYMQDISKARTTQDYIKAFEKLNNSGNNSSLNSIFNDSSDDTFSGSDNSNIFEDLEDSEYSDMESNDALTDAMSVSSGAMGAMVGIVIVVVLIIIVISFALAAFLFNPLTVGGKKWVLLNRTTKPDIGVFGFAFSNSYWNVVKVSFIRDIKIFLWTLLLIIPGIIKSYEYRMIPYLLAENPNMSSREAFEISRNLMTGNKWRAFVLDLSFILWGFLAALPVAGLFVKIFWLNPYVELTSGEFYVQLCAETGQVVKKQDVDFGDSWN